MANYAITFARSAQRELESLAAHVVKRIFPKIELLARQPRPPGCRKLVVGEEDLWRVRVGDYRIIYSIDDVREVVDIIAVRHRSKAYD
ncbi:MAG TPA: type II toxin-antitoxin system RelE/ParE family toxin [Pyrinomonadaceae bacterium]|nr:type II toxin-antitoxin system RelE/ParE family toxin [Pyrinomonadaceae bacterium]